MSLSAHSSNGVLMMNCDMSRKPGMALTSFDAPFTRAIGEDNEAALDEVDGLSDMIDDLQEALDEASAGCVKGVDLFDVGA